MAVKSIHIAVTPEELFGDNSSDAIEEAVADGVLNQSDIDQYHPTEPAEMIENDAYYAVRALYVNMKRFSAIDGNSGELSAEEAHRFREWFDLKGQSIISDSSRTNVEVLDSSLIGKTEGFPAPHIPGKRLLVVVHPTTRYDESRAMFSMDKEVNKAKQDGSTVLYLYGKDHLDTFSQYYPSDVDPDYFIASGGGQQYFTTEADDVTLIGGYFEMCYSRSIRWLLRNNSSNELTIRVPVSAVYKLGGKLDLEQMSQEYDADNYKYYLSSTIRMAVMRATISNADYDYGATRNLSLNNLTIEYKGEQLYSSGNSWMSSWIPDSVAGWIFGKTVRVVIE